MENPLLELALGAAERRWPVTEREIREQFGKDHFEVTEGTMIWLKWTFTVGFTEGFWEGSNIGGGKIQ